MADLINTTENIEKLIYALDKAKKEIKERGQKKAETISEYDRALAITMIKLKNGVELELDGFKVKDVPATNVEKISKGICYKERLELEKADAEYKSLITYIEVTEAQLNGFQSINKHLD